MHELYDQINDLYKLQVAAKELQHGIMKEQWSLFEPSKFVYAFFAFNSFYSIDWEKSAKEQEIVKWEFVKDRGEKFPVKKETEKISELSKFICNTFTDESLKNKEKHNAKEELSFKVSRKFQKHLKEDVVETLESLNGIVTDVNIKKYRKDKFIEAFRSLLENSLEGEGIHELIATTLKFVFSVRNNIFHGTKTVLDMMDRGQQIRLQVYTSILLSINEMLFEAIETRFEWSREQVDTDLKYKKGRNIHNNEHRLYTETIAKKFGITIPEGVLFYPCVGDDTCEPIKLFIDSVSEFHFVDSRLIPKLPKLEIEVKGYREEFISRRNSTRSRENYTFPINLKITARAFEPVKDDIDIQKINNLKEQGISFAGYTDQVGDIYKQEWQLGKDDKSVEIFRHVQDGLATFTSLDKIAVFFLRRDSEGEGGSGQRWFQKSIFKIVLDKLSDGGLIVTDGSSWDPSTYDTAEWKALWSNRSSKVQNNPDKPRDFVYYSREFRCIGQCGRGYGPLYVWQVTRL